MTGGSLEGKSLIPMTMADTGNQTPNTAATASYQGNHQLSSHNAAINVMPHPPQVGVGGGKGRDLT